MWTAHLSPNSRIINNLAEDVTSIHNNSAPQPTTEISLNRLPRINPVRAFSKTLRIRWNERGWDSYRTIESAYQFDRRKTRFGSGIGREGHIERRCTISRAKFNLQIWRLEHRASSGRIDSFPSVQLIPAHGNSTGVSRRQIQFRWIPTPASR